MLCMHFIVIFDIFCSHPVGITQESALPEFIVQVNDTNPLWFYCSQTDHCVRGMVFSVNADPNGNATFEDFQKLALASWITNPHIPPIEGGEISVYDVPESGSMSVHPYGDLSGSAATKNSKFTSSQGPIIGGIIGATALILLLVLGFSYRRSRAESAVEGGNLRFMGYAADSYPAAVIDGHTDYEPLVPPGEKGEVYRQSGAYDPPQHYSTTWNQ